MASTSKGAEPEIPDSDDLPGDDQTEVAGLAADDTPHGHPHTPGYPAHRHSEDGTVYDAGQVNLSGGLDMFPGERHDSDSAMAEGLEAERAAMADLSPLTDAYVQAARELGYDVEHIDHPASPGGAILGLSREGSKDVSVTVAYTE